VSQSSLAKTPDNFAREESRRSTRIERSVPLIIFGQNRMGEPFVERTVSTSINLHGCRYPSRHDYGVGAWITLQVVGLNVEPKPPAVRARVRSVHTSQSTRELQQVGVELENPGNVWGIVTPPQDWLGCGETTTSTAQFTTAAVEAPETPSLTAEIGEAQSHVEHKMAEVATFPSPSPVVAKPAAPKLTEAPKPQRVVITPDGLINALQGKLQQAAEKAVQAAVANQLDEAVRNALASIDDVRQSSVREVQELFPTRVESATLSSKEAVAGEIAAHLKTEMEKYRAQVDELAQRLERQAAELKNELARSQEFLEKMNREIQPQVHSGLSEAVARATSEFDGAAARTVDRRYERLLDNTQAITHEALLRLEARSAEVQALVQSAVNSALASFERQTEMHTNALLSETKERAGSALASLDAESRAACEARRLALETEVARSTERSTDQFRKGMKAFLYSCLVAAVSAVDEHSKSTLDGLLNDKDNGKSLHDASGDSGNLDEPQIIPTPDKDPFTH
jgi:sugar-specific transcriptional regulator TrmB